MGDLIYYLLYDGTFITISGWLATIIALVLAVVFFFIQKKRKEISYSLRTNVLISDKLSELKDLSVIYHEDEIEQLSITSVEFINSGNVYIENSKDFYNKKNLKIVLDDEKAKILFAKIEFQSSETIDGKINLQENDIIIDFQALEKGEKIIINIYHTGDSKVNFKVTGKIKNGGKIIEDKQIKLKDGILSKISFTPSTASILTILCIIFLVALFVTGYRLGKKDTRRYLLNYETFYIDLGDTTARLTFDDMENTIRDLTKEVKEKDEEIANLQQQLYGTEDSYTDTISSEKSAEYDTQSIPN